MKTRPYGGTEGTGALQEAVRGRIGTGSLSNQEAGFLSWTLFLSAGYGIVTGSPRSA